MMPNEKLLTSTKLPIGYVEDIFLTMLSHYGKLFIDQWAGVDAEILKQQWSESLAGFSLSEIKNGLKKMEALERPPTLPKFMELCRPSIDPISAYREAIKGVCARERGEIGIWSHPAIFWAAAPLSHDLKCQTFAQIGQTWARALEVELNKSEWAPIPEPTLMISMSPDVELSKTEYKKYINNIKAMLKINEPNHIVKFI